MELFDLLKKQTMERIEPITGRQPLSGTNVTLAPSVSDQSPDPELGEITDAKFGWRQTLIDQSVPSEDYFTTEILLAQILDKISKQDQTAVPGDFTRTINIPVAAQAAPQRATVQIYDITQFGYLYIPNNPTSAITSYRIYKGMGTSDLLYCGTNTTPRSFKLASIDVLTVQFDSDVVSPANFQCYLSVRPFMVVT